MDQPNLEVPVYQVKSESQVKVLHRNHLLPVKTDWKHEPEEKAEDSTEVKTSSINKAPIPLPRKKTKQRLDIEDSSSLNDKDTKKEELETLQEKRDVNSDTEVLTVNKDKANESGLIQQEDMDTEKIDTSSSEDSESEYVTIKRRRGTKQKKAAEKEEAVAIEEAAKPIVQPRRSGRTRRMPQRYDGFIMAATDKEEKVQVLKNLIQSGCLEGVSPGLTEDIINGIFS